MEVSLLHLAGCLTFVQAEKVAVQLKVDQRHISMFRHVYMEDSEMFAYKLLQKWWEACELESEFEARMELSSALKLCDLGGLARTVFGEEQDGEIELTKSHLMSVMKDYNHAQVEHVAIALGVRQNVIDSLYKMYHDDSQLFGYHILLHWKNSNELDASKQQEQLQLVLASTTTTTSTSFHCDDDDDIERDNSHSSTTGTSTRKGCCKLSSTCRWVLFLVILIGLFIISLTTIPILLTNPSFKDYSVLGQPGTTVLFSVSDFITGFNLKIDTEHDAWCTGKATALDCSEFKPTYTWYNVTRYTYIYMVKGSIFQFKLSSLRSSLSASDSCFLWVFSDYGTYSTAVYGGFQGFNCNDPGNGNWCYDINNESNQDYVNYTITRTDFYNIACSPRDSCCAMDMLLYQGSYSFDSLNNVPHSSKDLSTADSAHITLRSQFDYTYEQKCILVSVTNDIEGTCSLENSVKLLISDQKRQKGLLLFPGLLIFSLFIFNLVYSFCFCYKICRTKFNSYTNRNYQLVTITSSEV